MRKLNKFIRFHFLSPCSLKDRGQLKVFITALFKKEKTPLSLLSIVFCSDEYLFQLNREYLNHDYFTDILSFPLSTGNEPLSAEIYISIDRVRENARTESVSFQEELHRVIFHGVLHFCGYKDKTPPESKKMRLMEDKYLTAYFRHPE